MATEPDRVSPPLVDDRDSGLCHPEHELNPNWKWSDAVIDFVSAHITSPSLKVCTGFHPVCDVNVDIALYSVCPECEESRPPDAESCSECGTALSDQIPDVKGDMFDLEFARNSFQTVVEDPPWKELSADQRKAIFGELVRVASVNGTIINNAPWVPEHEAVELEDLRVRQEGDFFGNPSFIAIYRVLAQCLADLCDYWEYDLHDRYLPGDEEARDKFIGVPKPIEEIRHRVNFRQVTDLRCVDHTNDCYVCPMCGCAELSQGGGPGHEEWVYSCADCEYPATHQEVTELAEYLKSAQRPSGGYVDSEWVLPSLQKYSGRALSEWPDRLDPSLPWTPEPDTGDPQKGYSYGQNSKRQATLSQYADL